jgi:hypothetical protein
MTGPNQEADIDMQGRLLHLHYGSTTVARME